MNEDIEPENELKNVEIEDFKPKTEVTKPMIEEDYVEEDSIQDNSEKLSQYTNDSDISFSSFESFDLSDEEVIEEPNENVIDTIIDVFTVKRRRALIDTDSDEDLVSPEVSEIRLFNGLLLICIILCILCTILTFQFPTYESSNTNPWDVQENPKKSNILPSVTFVYHDGTLNNFQMDGIYIANNSRTLKLPSGKFDTTIFTFQDNGIIYFIYSDGYKDVTLLNLNNFKHGKIMNRKIPPKHVQISTTVRIGHYFWIIGGFPISQLKMDPQVRF